MNGSIFQNFPKFEQIPGNFLKIWLILVKIWSNIRPIGIWMGHFFLENLVSVSMGLLSNFRPHVPTKTKSEYRDTPPPDLSRKSLPIDFEYPPPGLKTTRF